MMAKYIDVGSVEAVESVLRGDPVKSFIILEDGFHFIGGQAVFRGEVFEDGAGGLG